MPVPFYSTGFISSIKYDNLDPWYTTTDNNEIIEFKDGDINRHINSLTIFANATALYVRILPFDYCLYIPAHSSVSYDYEDIMSMQVMGNAGQDIRWYAMFY